MAFPQHRGVNVPIFTGQPTWDGGVTLGVGYKTSIFEALDASEERHSQYPRPLYRVRYRTLTLSANETAYLRRVIDLAKEMPVGVPLWPLRTKLTSNVTAGATSLPIDTVRWLIWGVFKRFALIWRNYRTWEVIDMSSPSSQTLTLAAGIAGNWSAGDTVVPLLFGKLDRNAFQAVTDEHSTVEISCQELFHGIHAQSAPEPPEPADWDYSSCSGGLSVDGGAWDTFDCYPDGPMPVAVPLMGGAGWSGPAVVRSYVTPPTDVSGLLALWDAASIVAVDGDRLAQWNDTSGNGNHLTQATEALRPTYKVNQLPDGSPAVRFTDWYFNVPDVSGHSAYEIMILVKIDNDPPPVVGQIGLWKFQPSHASSSNNFSHIDGNIYTTFASTTQLNLGNPAHSLTRWSVYGNRSAAGTRGYWLEGVDFTIAGNTVSMPSSGCTIGYENYNNGAIHLYLRGSIACIALFSRLLTTRERAGVAAWLDQRRAVL